TDGRLQAARASMARTFLCPADVGLVVGDELDPARTRARGNYRVCVGDGDVYGDVRYPPGPAIGAFQVLPGQGPGSAMTTRLTDVADGTSNTLLLSEGLIGRAGPIGDVQTGTMGGAFFSTRDLPNSDAPDRINGPCPQQAGDGDYRSPCLTLAPGGSSAGFA